MTDEDVVHIVDELEARADGYISLEHVEEALGHSGEDAIARGLLLIDYRERIDATTGLRTPVTLCRLNRQHPLVRQLTAW